MRNLIFCCTETQRKAVKKQIKVAIANQDYTALADAINDALELDMKDDPDVKKGQQILDYARCSERKNLIFADFRIQEIILSQMGFFSLSYAI